MNPKRSRVSAENHMHTRVSTSSNSEPYALLARLTLSLGMREEAMEGEIPRGERGQVKENRGTPLSFQLDRAT